MRPGALPRLAFRRASVPQAVPQLTSLPQAGFRPAFLLRPASWPDFRFDLLPGAEPAVVLEQDRVLPLEPVLNFLVLLIGVGQPNGNDAGFFISGYFHAVSPFIQIVAGCGVL